MSVICIAASATSEPPPIALIDGVNKPESGTETTTDASTEQSGGPIRDASAKESGPSEPTQQLHGSASRANSTVTQATQLCGTLSSTGGPTFDASGEDAAWFCRY